MRLPRGKWLSVCLAGTLAFGIAQFPALGDMSDRGAGIIEFELAATSSHAQEIVTGWGEEGRSAARESLLLDYPYLIFYGLFLAGACAAVADRAAQRGKAGLARIGKAMPLAALGAAGADAIENAALLVVAGQHTDQPWPAIAALFAVIKFTLAIAATLYALVGFALTRGPATGR
jgi:hypothetical protein